MICYYIFFQLGQTTDSIQSRYELIRVYTAGDSFPPQPIPNDVIPINWKAQKS